MNQKLSFAHTNKNFTIAKYRVVSLETTLSAITSKLKPSSDLLSLCRR